jgi:hypothetical protein
VHGSIWTLTFPRDCEQSFYRETGGGKGPGVSVDRYDAKTCDRIDTGEINVKLAQELKHSSEPPWCSIFLFAGELWICVGRDLAHVRMLVFDGKLGTPIRSFDTTDFSKPDKLTMENPHLPEGKYLCSNRIRFLACPHHGFVIACTEEADISNYFILQ